MNRTASPSTDLAQAEEVLVTVTGRDTPGITAALTGAIAENNAELLDIEQVVVQGQLTLCMLLGVGGEQCREEPVIKDLLFTAKRMGLDMQFKVLEAPSAEVESASEPQRFVVTAIGDIDAAAVHLLARTLAERGANIENIHQLSGGEVGSIEIHLSLPADAGEAVAHALRLALIEGTGHLGMDVALQRERLIRRSKRLVVMDMDSTLIQMEVIDELARMNGVYEQTAELTRRAMAGELDFEESLRERVRLLAGLELSKVRELAVNLPITEGAREMLAVLRTLGYRTGVISGGFTFAANALKEQLGLHYAFANQLEVVDGKLTGNLVGPIVTPQRKADLLDALAQREHISLEQTIAIGDGANDLPMLERAGLGIAYHAKAKLRQAADTAVSAGGLDRILFLLGLRSKDIEELLQTVSE